MKIYQSARNAVPKLLAMFPLFVGFVVFGHGVKAHSIPLLVSGALLLIIGVWTFFGKAERYIDPDLRRVVSKRRWLWFSWGAEIPLDFYKYVAVVRSSTVSSGRGSSSPIFDVNLVYKHATSDSSGGFQANVLLRNFSGDEKGLRKAFEYASSVASAIDFKVHTKLKLPE